MKTFLAGEAGYGWVHFDLWAPLHHQPGERLQQVNLANLKKDISLEKLSKNMQYTFSLLETCILRAK